MAKIRHIAIMTRHPVATAEFFIKGFGFVLVDRAAESASLEEEWAVVSDGYINMTLLTYKVDRYGGGYAGLHHFGIQVDDLDQAEARLSPLGAVESKEWNQKYGNREGTPEKWVGERKWMTPEGVPIDINPTGWQVRPGGPRGEGYTP